MTLIKDDKSSKASGRKSDGKLRQNQSTVIKSPVETNQDSVSEVFLTDHLPGPSSGVRLTEAEREANLCEVFRLQRLLLKQLNHKEEEKEESD